MFNFVVYFLIFILLTVISIPWFIIMAVPVVVVGATLAVGSYMLVVWFSNEEEAEAEIRVLLVDDSPDTLVLIRNILMSSNCFVKIVDSGAKAIEELRRQQYDVMFLDYFMPGLNGVETLRLADKLIDRQVSVIEYSSGNEESIPEVPMSHFILVAKLNKNLPPSRLKPLVSQILSEVSV